MIESAKITFYIGLMDKDSLSYIYSPEMATDEVFRVLGDCTVTESVGSCKGKDGVIRKVKTLIAVKYMYPLSKHGNSEERFCRDKVNELKRIFNQTSILTEITSSIIDLHK